MSGSSALSGSLGKAVVGGSLVTRLTSWTGEESHSTSEWGDSESAGKTNSLPARGVFNGTIGGKHDLNKPPTTIFRSGDQPKLVLWLNPTPKNYWHFPSSTIKNYRTEVNPDTKEVVGWTADFVSDGAYYAPFENGAPAEALPTS